MSTTSLCSALLCQVGDGPNDLCAAVALRHSDVLLVRRGYPLDRILSRCSSSAEAVAAAAAAAVIAAAVAHCGGNGHEAAAAAAGAGAVPVSSTLDSQAAAVTAQVVRWSDGADIMEWMRHNGVLP